MPSTTPSLDRRALDRLPLVRRAAGLSLRQLGERCGISPAYLCHVEHGRRVGPDVARRLATALGVAQRDLT